MSQTIQSDDDFVQLLQKFFKVSSKKFDGLQLLRLDKIGNSYFFDTYSVSSDQIHSGRIDVAGDFFCDCIGFVTHRTVCRHVLFGLYNLGVQFGMGILKEVLRKHSLGSRGYEVYVNGQS